MRVEGREGLEEGVDAAPLLGGDGEKVGGEGWELRVES